MHSTVTFFEWMLLILSIFTIVGAFGLWIFKIGRVSGSKENKDLTLQQRVKALEDANQHRVSKTEPEIFKRLNAVEKTSRVDQGDILNQISSLLKEARKGTDRYENS